MIWPFKRKSAKHDDARDDVPVSDRPVSETPVPDTISDAAPQDMAPKAEAPQEPEQKPEQDPAPLASPAVRPDTSKLIIPHPVTFVASPYKTATTTVGKAVVALGVGKRDMLHRGPLLRDHLPAIKAANTLARQARFAPVFMEHHTDEVREILADLIKAVRKFDVFSDAPLGHAHVHPFVRKAIAPQSKFIWVHRPVEEWISSVRRWEEGHPETYARHVFWTSDPERRPRELRRMRKIHVQRFRALARAYPDDCLEIKVSELEDFTKLAAFYGVEPPEAPLKRYNVNSG